MAEHGGDGRRGRATLNQIATVAGVSKATASYALSGRGEVAEETRLRVIAVAESLGYHPNRAAREIARGTSTTLGAILSPTVPEPGSRNYYIDELLAGVEAECLEHDFRLQLSVWSGAAPAMVKDGSVGGLVYLGGAFPPDVASISALPAVLIGTYFPQWPFDAVSADNRRGAYLATSHLVRAGGQRIGFINGPSWTRTSEVKMLGYRDAMDEAGLAVEDQWVTSGDFTVISGYRCAQQMFANHSHPDALFVADDPMAIGVLRAFSELGVRVPDDVILAGYGDSPAATLMHPTLTSVRVFQEEMGALGAQRLIERITHSPREHVRILVAPELEVRESTTR